MTARFDVCYETDALHLKIEPMLSLIPPYFDLQPFGETCELTYHPHPDWEAFPFPALQNTVYIFCGDGMDLEYTGGNDGGRISVKILTKEYAFPKKIALRIWHELLHAAGNRQMT